jgi:hypothetical protein
MAWRQARSGQDDAFGECAKRYIAAQEAGGRNPKHAAQ